MKDDFIKLLYDLSAGIDDALLEECDRCAKEIQENNFKIFYYLSSGIDDDLIEDCDRYAQDIRIRNLSSSLEEAIINNEFSSASSEEKTSQETRYVNSNHNKQE